MPWKAKVVSVGSPSYERGTVQVTLEIANGPEVVHRTVRGSDIADIKKQIRDLVASMETKGASMAALIAGFPPGLSNFT